MEGLRPNPARVGTGPDALQGAGLQLPTAAGAGDWV